MGRIGLCVLCSLKFSVAMCILLLKKLESMLFCVRVKNVGKCCGGEKILSPLWFQHCGGERPRRPGRSDASVFYPRKARPCAIPRLSATTSLSRAWLVSVALATSCRNSEALAVAVGDLGNGDLRTIRTAPEPRPCHRRRVINHLRSSAEA